MSNKNKMPGRETLINIVNILRALSSAGLFYSFNSPICAPFDNLSAVTWPNHVAGAPYLSKNMFTRIDQYKEMLRNGAYHAILKDGSIVKAAYFFDRHETLVKHNLWYWPGPLAIPEIDIENFTPLDALDKYSLNWEEYIRFRTPLRFDYDKDGASLEHSSSHLHMQMAECRIGVQEPVCFANFVKFIFKNFYYSEWVANDFWGDLPIINFDNIGDFQSNEQKLFMHLRWNKQII